MSYPLKLITTAEFNSNINEYTFDGSGSNVKLLLGVGTYLIKGIEKNRPIAFDTLQNENIKFHGLSYNLFTDNFYSYNYKFYHGTVAIEVLGDFGSVTSYVYLKKLTNQATGFTLISPNIVNQELVFDNSNTNGSNTINFLEFNEIDNRKDNNFLYLGNKYNGKSVLGVDSVSSTTINYYTYINTVFNQEYPRHMCIRSNSIPNYIPRKISDDSIITSWTELSGQNGFDKQNFGYYNNGNRILGKPFKIPINPILVEEKNIPSNMLDDSLKGIYVESFWFKNNQYWKEIMTDRNYENINLSPNNDQSNTQNFPNSLTPLGPIGVAVNGIPFYNHFKMTDVVTNDLYTENYNNLDISSDRILTLSELTLNREDLVLKKNYDNYGGTVDINNNYYYNKYPVGLEAKIKLETVRNRNHNSTIYDKVYKNVTPDDKIYIYTDISKTFYFNVSEDGFKDYEFKIVTIGEDNVILNSNLKIINNGLEINGIPGETIGANLSLFLNQSELLFGDESSVINCKLQGTNNKLLFYNFNKGSEDKKIGDYKNIPTEYQNSGLGEGLTVSFTVAPGIKNFNIENDNQTNLPRQKTNGKFYDVEVLGPENSNTYDPTTGSYISTRNGSGLKISYLVEFNVISEDSIVITDMGTGYVFGETLTIQDELGHLDTTFKLTSEKGVIVENSIVIENIGRKYNIGDTIFISNHETGGSRDTKFQISDTGYININVDILQNSDDTNANKSKDYIYLKKSTTLLTSENNLGPNIEGSGLYVGGSGATLNITPDSNGEVNQNAGTVTVINTGSGYISGDLIKVGNGKIGTNSTELVITLTENSFDNGNLKTDLKEFITTGATNAGTLQVTNITTTSRRTITIGSSNVSTDGLGTGVVLSLGAVDGYINDKNGFVTVTTSGENYKVGDTLMVSKDLLNSSNDLVLILTENNFLVNGIKNYKTLSFDESTDYTGFLKNIEDSEKSDIKKFINEQLINGNGNIISKLDNFGNNNIQENGNNISTQGGFGSGCTVNYTINELTNRINSVTIINRGNGYRIGDILTITGTDTVFSVTEISSPGHSPILGWAFDGFPIYGQIGFESDDSSLLKLLKSSYVNQKYKEGEGDLDFCNGIFRKTPEFPQGIYHYVCTLKIDNNNNLDYSENNLYQYPYVIGAYKAIPDINNFLTPSVISTTSRTYNTDSTEENNSSLLISNSKNYNVNFRSLKSIEDFYNGSSIDSIKLSQDNESIFIEKSIKPYIFNFTNDKTNLDERYGADNSVFGNLVNNLTSNSDSVFKGYGNISKFNFNPTKNRNNNITDSSSDGIYTNFETTTNGNGIGLRVNFTIENGNIKDDKISITNIGTGYTENETITITLETSKIITFKLNKLLGKVIKFSNSDDLLVEKITSGSGNLLAVGVVLKEDFVNEYCYVITEGLAEVSNVNGSNLLQNDTLSFDNEGNIEKYVIGNLDNTVQKCILGTYVGKNNNFEFKNHLIKLNIHLIEG